MHLVILTHLSLFWVVCPPSRTYPPKEFEQESQNRLSLSPHRQTILSLASYPWPTILVLAWYKLLVPEPCACSTFMCVQSLSTTHAFAKAWRPICAFYYSFLTSCGVSGFRAFILYDLLSSWVGPCLIVGFSLFNPFFAPSVDLLAFLPCHSIIPAMVLLGLCLLDLFLGLLYAFSFT